MVIKVIEVIGTSSKGLQEAVEEAISQAKKTVRNITGADVIGWTLTIEKGKIVSWNANVKIAFMVER